MCGDINFFIKAEVDITRIAEKERSVRKCNKDYIRIIHVEIKNLVISLHR